MPDENNLNRFKGMDAVRLALGFQEGESIDLNNLFGSNDEVLSEDEGYLDADEVGSKRPRGMC